MQIGSFKTAHPRKVHFIEKLNCPPFTNRTVCVKQIYERREGSGAISRLKGRHELGAYSIECNILIWASILLDLTYQYIEREITIRGEPDYPILNLRFTRTMIAVIEDTLMEKAFLIEEWINADDDDFGFIKYVNNRVSQSCVTPSAPAQAHTIVAFLIFAQHVQWTKSKILAFTSDYQGSGYLLTDLQITAHPCVLESFCYIHANYIFFISSFGQVFGDGNLPRAFNEFRILHSCNHYCEFFGLTLDGVEQC
jgi:hypothetical protein